ncbi:hypothetical protein VP1G_03217 [Cytospora mali]|uniref:Efflux pump dotC n=1 Tax=Cytospora mali TaxID=578113 RepID=A0A194UW44_CYTMA|nr:hypothetical protein VP1G_03217 [Valsa mali var. pyri (nom. inval.)]
MAMRSNSRSGSVGDAKSPPTTSSGESLASNNSPSLQNQDPAANITRHDELGDSEGTVTMSNADNNSNAVAITASPQEVPDSAAVVAAAAAAAATQGQNDNTVDPPEARRTKLQTTLIMISLCSAVFLSALDTTIVTVAVPTISDDFNSTAGYTWIGSAYLLANAAAAPSWGKISDIWGRKPVILSAVGVFWIGSLLAGVSVNMAMLIVGRAVQGIGGGGIMTLCNICISDLFSMRKRGMYMGIISLVWAVAGGFGPVLGGVFTTKTTWRWCFYINLPISGCAMAILAFSLKLHNPRTGVREGLAAVDWLGALMVVGATLMVLLGLEFGGVTYPWNSPTVICLIVFGVVVAGLFLVVETFVAKFPVIPLRIFKQPSNIAVLGLNACHGFVFISASYYLPLYFQGVLGASPLMSGVYILPYTFIMGACSAVVGVTIKKTGKYLPPIIAGFVMMTLGYGLFIDLDSYANWPKIILYQLILGMGVGPNFLAPLVALQTTVQPRDIASATATYGFTRQLATSMSVVIGGVIFQNGMQKQYPTLLRELGPDVASLLTGSNAASSVNAVTALPEPQRAIAQMAYFKALRTMFIFYVAFAGLGIVLSFFVGSRKLSNQHVEHKTGLKTLQQVRTPIEDEEKTSLGAESGAGGVREENGTGESRGAGVAAAPRGVQEKISGVAK